MSYTHEYTEGLKQFGVIHLMLKLIDTDGLLPEVVIPVVLSNNEYTEENLNKIANQLIDSYTKTQEVIQVEPIILEEILNVSEEFITQS